MKELWKYLNLAPTPTPFRHLIYASEALDFGECLLWRRQRFIPLRFSKLSERKEKGLVSFLRTPTHALNISMPTHKLFSATEISLSVPNYLNEKLKKQIFSDSRVGSEKLLWQLNVYWHREMFARWIWGNWFIIHNSPVSWRIYSTWIITTPHHSPN